MASSSSWFSLDKITELKDKVEKAIPKVDDELIQKLTLRTPEMQAERANLEEEEKRRKHAARYLTQMLPWDTKDPEREILVEECKEAILALSTKEDSFLGPYLLPALPEGEGEAEGGAAAIEVEEPAVVEGGSTEDGISSADKLAKLEPLPPLLENFDLDTHVGLIRRLLDMDPNLVEMQSRLTAGGDKEMTFWRNYFFHCAYTRYEAGLSIDEIWAPKPEDEVAAEAAEPASDAPSTKDAAAAVAAAASNVFNVASGAAMSFMSKAKAAAAPASEAAAPAAPTTPAPKEATPPTAAPAAAATTNPPAAPTAPAPAPAAGATTAQTPAAPAAAAAATPAPAPAAGSTAANTPASSAASSDFEVVSTADATPKPAAPAASADAVEDVDLDDDEAIFGGGDPELDELEAEIAKELED